MELCKFESKNYVDPLTGDQVQCQRQNQHLFQNLSANFQAINGGAEYTQNKDHWLLAGINDSLLLPQNKEQIIDEKITFGSSSFDIYQQTQNNNIDPLQFNHPNKNNLNPFFILPDKLK